MSSWACSVQAFRVRTATYAAGRWPYAVSFLVSWNSGRIASGIWETLDDIFGAVWRVQWIGPFRPLCRRDSVDAEEKPQHDIFGLNCRLGTPFAEGLNCRRSYDVRIIRSCPRLRRRDTQSFANALAVATWFGRNSMEFQSKLELSRFLAEAWAARGCQDSPCGCESIAENICIHMNDKYRFE
jgi:hypothetical protein